MKCTKYAILQLGFGGAFEADAVAQLVDVWVLSSIRGSGAMGGGGGRRMAVRAASRRAEKTRGDGLAVHAQLHAMFSR